MELEVIGINGKATGRKAQLNSAVFEVEPNQHVVYLAVKHYLANQRQGTHKAKERAEISGSTKKLKKQKGTGTARAGSIKSPVFVGGGRVFGPRPRDYGFKLNKKVKDLARKSVLSAKVKDASITIVEDFNFDQPKTKRFLEMLEQLQLNNTKVLLLLPDHLPNVYLSGRNLPKSKVLTYATFNTYDALHADKILITEQALPKLEALLS
ncbi:MAG TPA: 50S ribosomal protein L4 [Microscillaceae bacterium]|jgi:large subunit ribosomal protein L4|nr:50S ribosomal protein L4 [Microscillaceae bacterium]